MLQSSLYRAIELLDMTICDPKNVNSLKETLRVKEVLVDFAIGENVYKSIEKGWDAYFLPYNLVARA